MSETQLDRIEKLLEKHVIHVEGRFIDMDKRFNETNRRIDDLRQDMQQQFRVVNERLAALESHAA